MPAYQLYAVTYTRFQARQIEYLRNKAAACVFALALARFIGAPVNVWEIEKSPIGVYERLLTTVRPTWGPIVSEPIRDASFVIA